MTRLSQRGWCLACFFFFFEKNLWRVSLSFFISYRITHCTVRKYVPCPKKKKKKKDKWRDKMKKREKMKEKMKRDEHETRFFFFFLKNVWELQNPPDELAQNVSKKNPFRTISPHFSSKVHNLTVFSIIYMIWIRRFGPWQLFQNEFRAARYCVLVNAPSIFVDRNSGFVQIVLNFFQILIDVHRVHGCEKHW